MINREFIKGLGYFCGWLTFFLVGYAAVVGVMTLAMLINHEFVVNKWVTWAAIPSLFIGWFTSWVTCGLFDTANDY